jgi:LEA14-like dessication related protein
MVGKAEGGGRQRRGGSAVIRSGYIRIMTIGLLASIGACSAISEIFKEPDVQLERVVVRGVGMTGGKLDLIIDVENPNGFTLHGTKLEVGFDVEGQHLGDIAYDDDFSVSENGRTTLTLPLTFGWAGVGSAVRAALGSGDLPYKMKGQVELRTPWGPKEVPFTREGRVALTRLARALAIPGYSE